MVETGINPSFYLTYENPSELIYTNSSDVYSSQYSVYRNQIIDYYRELKSVNEAVKGSFITDHKMLENNVTVVSYENGVTIYINYGETDEKADGVTVPALSYCLQTQ